MTSAPGSPNHLRRALRPRHVQSIALGGAVGAGLFLGSSGAIRSAGPIVLATYVLAALG